MIRRLAHALSQRVSVRVRVGLLLVFLGLLTWGTLKPQGPTAPVWPHLDKVLHFGAWFGLAVLLQWVRHPRKVWASIALAVAYGALIEGLQHASGWRDAEFADFAADTLGAFLGGLATAWMLGGPDPTSS